MIKTIDRKVFIRLASWGVASLLIHLDFLSEDQNKAVAFAAFHHI
jgi:hypothetical protein